MFRARDTRLNRDVAIKVLPSLFADDPDRLARFSREAQTLAALNHPNIAQIHGLEESDQAAAQGAGDGAGRGRRPVQRSSDAARFRSQRLCRSHGRLPMRSKRRTTSASSIAI